MKHKFLLSFVLSAASLAASADQTLTFAMGSDGFGGYEAGQLNIPVSGSFTDILNFTFPVGPGLATSGLSKFNSVKFAITDASLTVTMYEGLNATGAVLGSGLSLNDIPVLSGDFSFKVVGSTSGTSGGKYSFSATVTPVPEPGTYAMLLAGLAAVGFVAKRRRA